MNNKEFIYTYWGKTELGRKMIASEHVSEADLLFLIPNNVKKMHGIPLTRISGKQKRKRKQQRQRYILAFRLWELMEEIVEQTIGKFFANTDKHFAQFVEAKNLDMGDKV